METRLFSNEVDRLVHEVNFDGFFAEDCNNDDGSRRGGLALVWKEGITVSVLSSSLHHINAGIESGTPATLWRLCGVYGWPEQQHKILTWELLRELKKEGSPCWICAGDFNEIMYNHEKVGGALRDPQKIENFRLAVHDCQLEDVRFQGYKFTWNNNQEGDKNIQERLDRFLASEEWLEFFPNFSVEHLARIASDHCPILLHEMSMTRVHRKRKRMFRMEEMWFHDETCLDVCKEAWEGHSATSSPANLSGRLKKCRDALQEWETSHFGNVTKQLADCREKLKVIQNDMNGGV
ncbi:hypothetical protein C2S52_007247 [Perilla frutescens var. hirtella]|nr:hypothetical protein C2S52_007247 [Perilla frutescens var. hirtella]